jgi:glutamate racemase
MMDNPIGVFDSGIGGLTVIKHLRKILPNENLVYFGDTGRVPYGTRSDQLIRQYAREDAAFLQQFNIKLLIIACNTASAVAYESLKSDLTIPVTGVILPGVKKAAVITGKKKIGVIGTTATINSKAYNKGIQAIDDRIETFGQPCPLLVPLVEEGWIEDEVTFLTLKKYLSPLLEKDIDTLILGCTHYPVIKEAIQTITGPAVTLIDSGEETALYTQQLLAELDLARKKEGAEGCLKLYVSDIPAKFSDVGSQFLGFSIGEAERVDFDAFLQTTYAPLNG